MAKRNVISRLWCLVKTLFSEREVHNEPVYGNEGHSTLKRPPLQFNPEFSFRYPRELRDRASGLRKSVESSASKDLPPMPEQHWDDFLDDTKTLNPDFRMRRFSPSAAERELPTLSGLKAERLRVAEEKRLEYRKVLSEVRSLADTHRYQEAITMNRALLGRMDDGPEFSGFRSEAEENVKKIANEAIAWAEAEKERLRREEEERRKLRQMRIRAAQRESILKSLESFRKAIGESDWSECRRLEESLDGIVTSFQDTELSSIYKAALGLFNTRYLEYRKEQKRLKEERIAAEEREKARQEEERLRKLRQETFDAVQRMRSAADEWRWADYAVEKRRVSEEILRTDSATRSLYDEAVGIYDARQREVERQRKEKEARELAERRERERIERLREETRREEEEKRRIDSAKSQYIRKQIDFGVDCICLFDYYSLKSYGYNISQTNINIREKLWRFKDGNMVASAFFCDKLSSCLESIYADSLHGMWICTAQASTPEKAELRYQDFCQRLSDSCGIHDGFGLISVIGVKSSAHSGCGIRGDISNLEISDGVRGKRIVLLDDICTSGATMNNLRKKILVKGAASVDCFALGRTV